MRYAGLIGAGIAELLHLKYLAPAGRGFLSGDLSSKEQELIVGDTLEGRGTSIDVEIQDQV